MPNAVSNAEGPAEPAQNVLTWQVPQPSPQRAYQLLSALGWLPLKFKPDYKIPRTRLHQLAAVTTPPTGTWSWKWKRTPASLKALWTPDDVETNTVLKGAIMAFEDQHQLPVDGYLDDQVWSALLDDSLHHRANTAGYTYVMVSESVPENGAAVAQRQGAVPGAGQHGHRVRADRARQLAGLPAHPGGDMSGTNPDGSHYTTPASSGSPTSTAGTRCTPSSGRATATRRASAASR